MENIIKVDQAMNSVKQAILKTDDAQIIKDSEYLREYFASLFQNFLADIHFLAKYAQSPLIPNSDLMLIDDLVAEILLKNIRPGKYHRKDATKPAV